MVEIRGEVRFLVFLVIFLKNMEKCIDIFVNLFFDYLRCYIGWFRVMGLGLRDRNLSFSFVIYYMVDLNKLINFFKF